MRPDAAIEIVSVVVAGLWRKPRHDGGARLFGARPDDALIVRGELAKVSRPSAVRAGNTRVHVCALMTCIVSLTLGCREKIVASRSVGDAPSDPPSGVAPAVAAPRAARWEQPTPEEVERFVAETNRVMGGDPTHPCKEERPLPESGPSWSSFRHSPLFCGTDRHAPIDRVMFCETATTVVVYALGTDGGDEFFFDKRTDRVVALRTIPGPFCMGDVTMIASPPCKPTLPARCDWDDANSDPR